MTTVEGRSGRQAASRTDAASAQSRVAEALWVAAFLPYSRRALAAPTTAAWFWPMPTGRRRWLPRLEGGLAASGEIARTSQSGWAAVGGAQRGEELGVESGHCRRGSQVYRQQPQATRRSTLAERRTRHRGVDVVQPLDCQRWDRSNESAQC